jgi:hypothetical protein
MSEIPKNHSNRNAVITIGCTAALILFLSFLWFYYPISPVNQNTYVNNTYVNQTLVNQTLVNQTLVNQTLVNQTVVNNTYVNNTYVNHTLVNQTLVYDTYVNNTCPRCHGLSGIQKMWNFQNLQQGQGQTGTITEWLTDSNGNYYGGYITLTYDGQNWAGGNNGNNPQYTWQVAQLSDGVYYIINYQYSFTILGVTTTGSGTDTHDDNQNWLQGQQGQGYGQVTNYVTLPPT